MNDMFDLSAPWWHFVLRAIAVYGMVIALMRMSGKRSVGQFTPFDLVLLILIGNAVQNGLNGGDSSLTGALILAATLIALNYGVAFLTSRYRRAEHLIEGVPMVLARDGMVFEEVLRREFVSKDDFYGALRSHNVAAVEDVALALLETNGSISVVPKDAGGSERAMKYVERLPRGSLHSRQRRKADSDVD